MFMKRKKITVKEYNLLIDFLGRNAWMREDLKKKAFFELMELCQDSEQQMLLCDLLDRFTYLTGRDVSYRLEGIANQIVNVWQLPEEKTQIVVTSHTDGADSSHSVIQNLKPYLTRHKWSKCRLVSQLGRAERYLTEYPNVVIVDEFAGTGSTILNRVNTYTKRFTLKSEQANPKIDFNIYVCLIACMRQGKELLESEGVKLHSELILSKGISDNYVGKDYKRAIKRMLKLESMLANEYQDIPLPSLGYGRTESLYSAELGNIPNSVFPIFWWPALAAGTIRETLFHRWESD